MKELRSVGVENHATFQLQEGMVKSDPFAVEKQNLGRESKCVSSLMIF